MKRSGRSSLLFARTDLTREESRFACSATQPPFKYLLIVRPLSHLALSFTSACERSRLMTSRPASEWRMMYGTIGFKGSNPARDAVASLAAYPPVQQQAVPQSFTMWQWQIPVCHCASAIVRGQRENRAKQFCKFERAQPCKRRDKR